MSLENNEIRNNNHDLIGDLKDGLLTTAEKGVIKENFSLLTWLPVDGDDPFH